MFEFAPRPRERKFFQLTVRRQSLDLIFLVLNPIIMTLWAGLWILLAILVIAFGFCCRMGIELRRVFTLLYRFRRISLYNFKLQLESSGWEISRTLPAYMLTARGTYPRIRGMLPLVIEFSELEVCVQDGRGRIHTKEIIEAVGMDIISGKSARWREWATRGCIWLLEVFRPVLQVNVVSTEYVYEGQSVRTKLVDFSANIMEARVVSSGLSVSVSDDYQTSSFTISPVECLIDVPNSTVEITSDHISSEVDFFGVFGEWMNELTSQSSPSSIRRRKIWKLNWLIRNSISANLTHTNSEGKFSLGSGAFVSSSLDPVSWEMITCSFHTIAPPSGRHRTTIEMSHMHSRLAICHLTGLSVVLDTGDEWTISSRTRSITVSLGDDKLIDIRNLAITGTEKTGASLSVGQMEIDASERLLFKLARIYMKFTTSVISRDPSSSHLSDESTMTIRSTTPSILKSPIDPNFERLRQRYNSMVNLDISAAISTPPPSTVSRSVSAEQPRNWRSVERMMMRSGRMILHAVVEKLILRNGESLSVKMNKLKITSKTSSMGTPFTSVTTDSISVNSNITSSPNMGGFRFWIDGNLSGSNSRVFCLIPPIEIRFDPQFAATVETYFLQVANVLRTVNRGPSTATTTTRKFLDFLQISSLQLELHAKEMLGVLALDKALIKLNRSSVYKSNGLADALEALGRQYKEEVAGQWLNLVMHLDVAIGRPVSAAKKLLGKIYSPN